MSCAPRFRILVVDDDILVRDLFRRLIERLGHEAILLETGEDALASIAALPPDLLLLDHRLPGKTGLDVLEEMRQNSATLNTPVFFVTGVHEERVMARAHGLNVKEIVLKPVDYVSFLTTIQDALVDLVPVPVTPDAIAEVSRIASNTKSARRPDRSALPRPPG